MPPARAILLIVAVSASGCSMNNYDPEREGTADACEVLKDGIQDTFDPENTRSTPAADYGPLATRKEVRGH
ncbi:MAG: hypothetical protein JWP03_4324 [Phycisphaerales bacterium]|nr:hypothetical protein [Phycisphaerales bacterium]